MTKLTEKEREGFEKILSQDLGAINARFMSQIKDFWGIARGHKVKGDQKTNLLKILLQINNGIKF